MRQSLANHCTLTFLGKCDLGALSIPENADKWTCNKPINQGKVEKTTKCQVVCMEGHDRLKGKTYYIKNLNIRSVFNLMRSRYLGFNDIETWHGENDIAYVLNEAGSHPLFGESLMFDSDPGTFWHSDEENNHKSKIIRFQFRVSF